MIIVIAIAVLVGTVGWYFTRQLGTEQIISPVIVNSPQESSEASIPTESNEVLSSVGSSILENELEAVAEAVAKMQEKLINKPDLVVVYSTAAYDEEKILTELERLLPGTKIFGGNSGFGVITPGEYLWFPVAQRALAVMGIATPKITWGLGISSIEGISSREAAKEALLSAMKDSGKGEGVKPNLIIDNSTFWVQHEEALKGIADVVGADVPVYGAYSVDKGIVGDWRIFINGQVYQNGVALAAVYTDLKFASAREHGFEVTEKGGVATKVDKYRLYEIDGRPAAEVYNELIGGLLAKEVADPEHADLTKIRLTSGLNPLAKSIAVSGGEPFYVPALSVSIMPDKSMMLDVEVKEGDELRVLRGDWEILLNRLRTTPEKAMLDSGIKKEKIIFALNAYCCATHYVVPETERPKSPEIFQEAIGAAPYIGVCGCGIENYEPQIGNVYSSLGNGVLLFSSEEN
ncbi:MAG: putative secreted protein [Parcubacteria group bacterium GW2011_GWA2_42_28]|nr:MAG: putative secreted protein [Parcubacteria group bacterium GW2011_GWA2_42_28]KKT53969.1 MAG: putative secreted protein [Parcubacteria group bacterium GW2011_GWC2_44_22]